MKYAIPKKHSGFSLMELIIFIIVISSAAGILISFNVMLRFTHNIDWQTQALELAQQRMELITKTRDFYGFTNMCDVCAPAVDRNPICSASAPSLPPPACSTTLNPDYAVTATVTQTCQQYFPEIPTEDCYLIAVTVKRDNKTVAFVTRAITDTEIYE